MKSIRIQNADLAEMREFYREEFDKAIKKLQHIKNVLDQLGDTKQSIEIRVSGIDKTGSRKTEPLAGKTKKKKTAARGRKKPGRASIWDTLVLNRLKDVNKPLSYDQLTEEIMKFSKLPAEKLKSTKQAIVNVTFRLRNRDNKIDTFSTGGKVKYLGLKEWFDTNGKILKQYLDSVKELPQKAKKKPAKKKTKIKAVSKTKTTAAAKNPVTKTKSTPKAKAKTTTKSKAKSAPKAKVNPKIKTKIKPAKTSWSDILVDALKKENKPLSVKELTQSAMNSLKIDKNQFDKTRLTIASSLTRLEKVKKQVQTHKAEGGRSIYYGLPDWFNKTGNIKPEYQEKIS